MLEKKDIAYVQHPILGVKKRIVYVAHPVSGDVDNNLADLARILRKLNLEYPDIAFCAPYYGDIIALNDNDPIQRKRGIDNSAALIISGMFTEIWLTGNKLSHGMQEELKLFTLLGLPYQNHIGKL